LKTKMQPISSSCFLNLSNTNLIEILVADNFK
jgi:hypothetical protein